MALFSTTFDKVQAWRRWSGNCAVCGEKTRRERTFTHTINPYNRNDDGTTKTREQVRADVNEEADHWMRGPVLCTACERMAT